MRNMVVLTLAGAALLFAGASSATGTTDNAKEANAAGGNKIICKYGPPQIGSLIGRTKVCKTKLQWEQERLQAQRTLTRVQDRGIAQPKPNNKYGY